MVDESLWYVALLTICVDGRLALALGHLGAVRVEDQGQVCEDRRLRPKRPEEQDVLGRVGEVVLTADDVGDIHGHVIDHDHEVIQRRAVRASDDEIAAQLGGVDADVPSDQVVELDDTLAHAEADDRLATFGAPGLTLGLGERGTAAAVAGELRVGLLVGGTLLGRAEAGVGLVLGQQALDGLACTGRHAPTGGTDRRRRRQTVSATSGPSSHSRPSQCKPVEDVLLEFDAGTGLVGVLEAQHEGATRLAREQVVEQRGPGRADMEWAGGAGRDAAPRRHRVGFSSSSAATLRASAPVTTCVPR